MIRASLLPPMLKGNLLRREAREAQSAENELKKGRRQRTHFSLVS